MCEELDKLLKNFVTKPHITGEVKSLNNRLVYRYIWYFTPIGDHSTKTAECGEEGFKTLSECLQNLEQFVSTGKK